MKKQLGFSSLAIILIIAGVIVVGGAFYWLGTQTKSAQKITQQTAQSSSLSSSISVSSSSASISTKPSIIVTSPNGGESYKIGDTVDVRWSVSGMRGNEYTNAILIYENGENFYGSISGSKVIASAASGDYKWLIPNTIAPGRYKLEISVDGGKDFVEVHDLSDNYFNITSPSGQASITVMTPTTNETITNPFYVTGVSNTFEGVVSIRIKDKNGKVLATDSAMGGSGQLGAFYKSVTYSMPSVKNGTIEVFENSAKDGSEINKVTVPVIFGNFKIAP
jgi:hypothetical protein